MRKRPKQILLIAVRVPKCDRKGYRVIVRGEASLVFGAPSGVSESVPGVRGPSQGQDAGTAATPEPRAR